jgi:hypothetical protein
MLYQYRPHGCLNCEGNGCVPPTVVQVSRIRSLAEAEIEHRKLVGQVIDRHLFLAHVRVDCLHDTRHDTRTTHFPRPRRLEQ